MFSSLLLGDGKSGYVDSHGQVLCNLQVFARAMPSLFAPYFEDFFICSSDSYQIKALKLEILSSIATDSSISSIFREFQVLAAFLRNFFFLVYLMIFLHILMLQSSVLERMLFCAFLRKLFCFSNFLLITGFDVIPYHGDYVCTDESLTKVTET